MATPIMKKQHKKDWLAYCRTTGATDKKELFEFVQGCYDLGIWDNMVCWPLRSGQQATSGLSSLGGRTFAHTVIGSPTMGVDGFDFSSPDNNISRRISLTPNITTEQLYTTFSVVKRVNTFMNGAYFTAWEHSNWGTAPDITEQQITVIPKILFASPAPPDRIPDEAITEAQATSFRAYAMSIGATEVKKRAYLTGDPSTGAIARWGVPSLVHVSIGARGYDASSTSVQMPFAALFLEEVSSADLDSFYSIYKNTLGQGLSLP